MKRFKTKTAVILTLFTAVFLGRTTYNAGFRAGVKDLIETSEIYLIPESDSTEVMYIQYKGDIYVHYWDQDAN